ncbi:MAG: DUF3810 domain-containing protein [Blastocatellales bacterium]
MDELATDDGNPFTTRRSYWRGIVWLLIALGVQAVASMMSEEVEAYYSRYIFYYITRWLSAGNKYLQNYAIGEIFFALLVVWFGLWSLWYLRRSWRRESRLFDVLKVFFLQLLWVMSFLFPVFLVLWGLNYQRLPLAETLGFDRRPARAGELESIGLQIVSGVNSNYEQARSGRDGAGGPLITRDTLFKSIERAFQSESLLGEASQGAFSNPKPLVLSRLTSLMGVTGFYIPFTGEVTFNEQSPPFDLPMVIAHHKAHQRGYAREDEANFIAYIVCINSTEPFVRYSGYLHGLKVLETLSKGNPDRYADFAARVGEGPQTDLRDRSEFWGNVKNSALSTVARRTFSAYLRANRVHGGVKNYDEDIPLIIGYYLKYPQRQLLGGEQFPDAGAETPQEGAPQGERTPDMF